MAKVSIVTTERKAKIEKVEVSGKSLVVFVGGKVSIRIKAGATLREATDQVYQIWPHLGRDTRRLVAYWFDLGENLTPGEAKSDTSWSRRFTP